MPDNRIALAENVFAAIEAARCPGREGPYGLYDYSNYSGNGPPHVVRDFRDMRSDDYGKFIFRSRDPEEARARFEELTRQHIGLAAIAAIEGSPAFAALRADHDAGGAAAKTTTLADEDETAEDLFQSERISAAQAVYDEAMEHYDPTAPDHEVYAFDAMKAAIARADAFEEARGHPGQIAGRRALAEQAGGGR